MRFPIISDILWMILPENGIMILLYQLTGRKHFIDTSLYKVYLLNTCMKDGEILNETHTQIEASLNYRISAVKPLNVYIVMLPIEDHTLRPKDRDS